MSPPTATVKSSPTPCATSLLSSRALCRNSTNVAAHSRVSKSRLPSRQHINMGMNERLCYTVYLAEGKRLVEKYLNQLLRQYRGKKLHMYMVYRWTDGSTFRMQEWWWHIEEQLLRLPNHASILLLLIYVHYQVRFRSANIIECLWLVDYFVDIFRTKPYHTFPSHLPHFVNYHSFRQFRLEYVISVVSLEEKVSYNLPLPLSSQLVFPDPSHDVGSPIPESLTLKQE